jgi:hypothetical protein
MQLYSKLHLSINKEKSELNLETQLRHLGFILDIPGRKFLLPDDRVTNM